MPLENVSVGPVSTYSMLFPIQPRHLQDPKESQILPGLPWGFPRLGAEAQGDRLDLGCPSRSWQENQVGREDFDSPVAGCRSTQAHTSCNPRAPGRSCPSRRCRCWNCPAGNAGVLMI